MPINLLSLLGGLGPGMQAANQMNMQQQGQQFGQAATLMQLAQARQQALQDAQQQQIANELAKRQVAVLEGNLGVNRFEADTNRLKAMADQYDPDSVRDAQLRELLPQTLAAARAKAGGDGARMQDVISIWARDNAGTFLGTKYWDDVQARWPEVGRFMAFEVQEKVIDAVNMRVFGGDPRFQGGDMFSGQFGFKSYEEFMEKAGPIYDRAVELADGAIAGDMSLNDAINMAVAEAHEHLKNLGIDPKIGTGAGATDTSGFGSKSGGGAAQAYVNKFWNREE